MGLEVVRRGLAVGALLGAAAAAETIRSTPALHAGPPAWLPAFELASLFVCAYGALGVALGAVLAPLPRIGGARALWPLALLAAAFAALNESARHVDWIDAHRHAARAAIGIAAVAAVAHALLRPARTPHALRRLEAALAALAVPAALGAALYAARPFPGAGGGSGSADVIAFAPRFAPEPPEALASARAPGRPRALLIGVDGASWDRIERGIAAGRLPTFEALRARGVSAPLASVVPTYSPSIWTSVVTGVAPQRHGIEDFYLLQLPRLGVENLQLRRSFGVMRWLLERSGELALTPVTSSLRRSKALWNLADEAELRSAVVGLWATWPPEPLRSGVVVSDHASAARQQEWLDRGKASAESEVTTWPPELAQRLAPLQRAPESVSRDELARFVRVDDALWREFEATRAFSKSVPISAFRSSHLNDDFYARAAFALWSDAKPDLLVLYLRSADELSHFFYEAGVAEASALGWSADDVRRYGDVVDNAYAWIDRALAPLVGAALAGGDTLIAVVSDHGWEREASGRYNHNDAPPGILILAGAGVCGGDCPPLRAPSIYDVAPTLLERLGLPLSAELVGRPLREAFTEPRESPRVAAYGAPLGAARAMASGSDAATREKLEALGYLRK